MKRLISFCLSVILCFSAATPIFSAESLTEEISNINSSGPITENHEPDRKNVDNYAPDPIKVSSTEGYASKLPITRSVYGSVYDSVYQSRGFSQDSSSNPTPYDQIAYNNVNLKIDEAPFSISSSGESISTVTGSLSLHHGDLTLPGRNGLSFTLERVYDSTAAQWYEPDVEAKDIYHYRVYPSIALTFDKRESNGAERLGFDQDFYNPVDTPRFAKNYDNLTIYSDYYKFYYCGSGDIPSDQFEACYKSSVDQIEKDRLAATAPLFRSEYMGPSNLGNYYRMSGYFRDLRLGQPRFSYWFMYNGFFNKANPKTYEEKMFPIGKGWSWNISSIETKKDKKYLHLANKGTYEISDYKLKGYPWKDLSFSADSSVNVNGEVSTYVLRSLDGTQQFFNSDGKLIQIEDIYGNTIQFLYSNVDPYGKVLTGIKDALGNQINIYYSANSVVLQLMDQKVTYTKTNWNGKEILQSVQDQVGNKTSYNYELNSAKFNFWSNTSQNQPLNNPYGLLSSVQYPTGASTSYSYALADRYFGPDGYNQVYKVTKRLDRAKDGSVYNQKTFSYSRDVGSSYPTSYDIVTTVDDGLKTTTFTNYKQHLNDKEPPYIYTKSVVEAAGDNQKIQTMSYDTERRLPLPDTISTIHKKGDSSSPKPIVTQRKFDDFGNVLSETNAQEVTTTYTYNANNHWLETVTKPISPFITRLTKYVRDNQKGSILEISDREIPIEGPREGNLKAQVNFTYDNFGNPTTVTLKDDNRNIVVNKAYSDVYKYGFLTQQTMNVTDADGGKSAVTQQFQYEGTSMGKISKYIDGKNLVTEYQYDPLGRVTTAIFPDKGKVVLRYDDSSNEITKVDQAGVTSYVRWNELGYKVSEGVSGGQQAKYGYDMYGRLAWSEDGLSHRTSYSYDAWNRLVSTTYPDNSTSTVSYDDIGNTATLTDQEGTQTKETYDYLQRVTKKEWLKASGPELIEKNQYDFAGNLSFSLEGNFDYDIFNRLIAVDASYPERTKYAYNMAGKLTQILFADGSKEIKEYDELGRMIKKTDASNLVEKYFYDANNNLIRFVDRNGQVTSYEYNFNNLQSKSITGNEAISYDYDSAGRRTAMQDATGRTEFHYNTAGQLDNVRYPDGRTIQYSYDRQGNRTHMTDPFGFVTMYGYDSRNQLTDVMQSLNERYVSYEYKKNGLLSAVKQSNSIASSYNYDGYNLVGLTQTKPGATINTFNYGYDYKRNVIQKTENGAAHTFTYDHLNRIRTSSQFDELYTYDLRGNRETVQSTNNFNMSGADYRYDDRNRLVQVTNDDGRVVSYRYNGDGMLYERTGNGQTTRYYYDGPNIIAEGKVVNGSAALKARYIRGNGLAVRVDANGTKAYYLQNGHGDIVGLSDANGNVINQYTYDIWGNPLTVSEQIEQPFRYSGEYWDNRTNLQFLRARWYDPSVGRFITQDPLEGQLHNPRSLNLYTYVLNNPLRYKDSTGNLAEEDTTIGGGGMGAGFSGSAAATRAAQNSTNRTTTPSVRVAPRPVEEPVLTQMTVQAEANALSRAATKGTGNVAKSSPIKIPDNAVKVEQAKNGYDQIKYTWSDGTYKYEARWHTRTPGAPADQGNTWVVTRTTPGSQTTRKVQHILTSENQWTPMKQWQDAVSARQNGVATPEQQALLDSGHWLAP
ncbi:RHS repeat domain-containing protein [Paenibacillus tyrfis]|uniref:RHS repeat domain-containing protein n=1 Tax=Paenibacillus tyrfis TaxID=1501230 RepID=UPI000B58DE19|nr:RHS repeat-associated core domain-containing protein [Paenibacillus tyrfis]